MSYINHTFSSSPSPPPWCPGCGLLNCCLLTVSCGLDWLLYLTHDGRGRDRQSGRFQFPGPTPDQLTFAVSPRRLLRLSVSAPGFLSQIAVMCCAVGFDVPALGARVFSTGSPPGWPGNFGRQFAYDVSVLLALLPFPLHLRALPREGLSYIIDETTSFRSFPRPCPIVQMLPLGIVPVSLASPAP
jgi:hypothetical protein